MTTRDRDPPDSSESRPRDPERMLEALVDAADRTAEHDVLSHELPSFAAIVARAHRMEPAVISADDVDYASGVHRVVPRPIERGVPEHDEESELDLFVESFNASVNRSFSTMIFPVRSNDTPTSGSRARASSNRAKASTPSS